MSKVWKIGLSGVIVFDFYKVYGRYASYFVCWAGGGSIARNIICINLIINQKY